MKKLELEEIMVITVTDVITDLYGPDFYTPINYDLEVETALVRRYCDDSNFHYYAKPKDSFSLYEALKEASNKYCEGVVIECLS